ncbi:BolA-like protein [Seiridium cupressi]
MLGPSATLGVSARRFEDYNPAASPDLPNSAPNVRTHSSYGRISRTAPVISPGPLPRDGAEHPPALIVQSLNRHLKQFTPAQSIFVKGGPSPMLSRTIPSRLLAGARIGSSSRIIALGQAFPASSHHRARGMASESVSSQTPVEDTIRAKLMEAFSPTYLEIYNDSHLHSHHKAMQGSTSKETHFRLYITSDAFKSKMQPARHRMVYSLLKDDMAREGGIHALQLRTRTPDEEERARKLEAEAN